MSEDIRLNSTHFFTLKIPNKRELQEITFNNSSDIDFKDFMNLYEKCTAKPYSINDKIRDENCNAILTEKLQKY